MFAGPVTAQLLQRAREHDSRAITRIVEAWEPGLLRLAARSLLQQVRSQVDAADVLQEVWFDFFRQRLALLATDAPQEVLAYVRTTVRHQAAATNRAAQRQRRDVGRTQALHDLGGAA